MAKPQFGTKSATVALGLVLAVAAAGIATALVTDTNIGNKTMSNDEFRGVYVFDANLSQGTLKKASVDDSVLSDLAIEDATIRNSYLHEVDAERVSVSDSRVEDADLDQAQLEDVTLCNGECRLVSGSNGDWTTHARLPGDAPATVSPGDSFDLRVTDVDAQSLMVTNDPAGSTAFGFDPTAADSTIESIELLRDGEVVSSFAFGESVSLADVDGDFTLRVHVAEAGVVDGSTLGLVLDLDGHGLRTAMSSVDVVATQLAFAPPEAQAFAPFLADNVARLVISVATDENGNLDRDLDIAYTVDVLDVNETNEVEVVGDLQHHAFLHGDSEFFSETPFLYDNPTSEAAHHPATLEVILRDMVGIEGITFGAASFYATHLVAQSPFATSVELTASTTTAAGERLEAGPYQIDLGELPEEPRSASTPFGPMGDPMFPGEGTLRVQLVGADGEAVEAEDDWVLMVQETPDSHQTQVHISLAGEGSSFELPLASSEPVGLPFGDFVPHEYKVCVHHDDQTSCANDGDLISIRNGETTHVEIDVS